MGDSDEEYDRRRARDKFRRERSDYQERGREERGRRDDWSERDGRGSRREYRDYDPRNRRDRYSPARHDISPPMKRMRRDWDDRGGGYGNNFDGNYPSGGMMGGMHSGWGMHGQMNPQREVDSGLTQPPMMTFKQFLSSQDDGIDDQEAVKKYNEYKLEFKRQQINEFFLNHKDEEWFKLKHHPEESLKRKAELHAALKRRLDVFMELYEKGWVDAVSVDQEKHEQIIRFLDAVVIKLEGGTDFDLKVLDQPYEEEKPKELVYLSPSEKEKKDEIEEKEEVVKRKKKRKDSQSSQSGENDSSAESESDEDSLTPVNMEENEESHLTENGETTKKKSSRNRSRSRSGSEKEDSIKDENSCDKSDVVEKEDLDDSLPEKEAVKKERSVERDEGEDLEKRLDEDVEKEEDEGEAEEEKNEPKPRPLHKTHSIFLRYLAPSITKQEVEALCKRFPGFLRVAIADPQPERRFVRRAWVTFERSVNIKEMCWKLNGIRLRDSELGAIVNRDLSRRIRSVNGISSHKQVVRADIKLAARIIQNLDKIKKLWEDDEKSDEVDDRGILLTSKNPLLKNITDYLIEEASAEEDELLGMGDSDENKDSEEGCTLERDESLIKVLDRLLLYLRVVHSVDYYNSSEYPSEDEMPNRCGIMHARGSPPSSKVTQQEINDYISHFEMKSQTFLQTPTKLDEEECIKLGKKDPDAEVEKFIQANTQELAKDKWLCPLSGKKFKGPEFVRKHIYNKHAEKIEEVKKEVEYFNNYLMDPKRAQLPEHPSNRSSGSRTDMHNMGHPFHGGPFPPPMPPYGFGPRGPGPNFPGFGQNYGRGPDMYRSGGYGKRNFQRLRTDPREIIGYHDVDSPQDVDYF
ncbi:serrate RNA effector molecule homolog isoform X2 [Stegodyphus dumicola]|uniref:serrate RNA effector molecule homolog isoform X2 n=1 Tax=Stegodyphus dumicola TaxID=202533 RepID=UPI0015B0CFF7|nr:serrate RNA effector molecule homolog isoform X2 [Stegodyphus dumicola]